MGRTLPNIIITGTPGTGKSSHCELLAQSTNLKHMSITDVVKKRECHEGWDDELQTWIVDEDKVCVMWAEKGRQPKQTEQNANMGEVVVAR